ncbi:DsbA family oxidoreductase [Georgenia sp. TF02-10]|uniref:DsbA family oxidoreductase n=1 Tax=Georgenia sp. TF02-10 TaxID=2917725 RepID=UPI001FA72EBB|nr:DsbA family oxidoreductase [Georgenia sp. TF02-10]UNX54740.1 DsbA family oxidoreductase [Georgenia sp. TF02-10]
MTGETFERIRDHLVVDVWSDVMCPFCYMGDALLARALEQFPHKDDVEVHYHSFLLMPELSSDTPIDLNELLAAKRGFPREQAAAMNEQIAARGREVGLEYRFDRVLAVSTRTAHELSHFAAAHGKQHEMVQRLFQAYFTDGLNVADHQVLADLATGVGLDRDATLAALASGRFADAVDADVEQARQMGISGVPFFVFAGKYAVSGAQPVEVFGQALETSWNETVGTAAGAGR